MNQYLCNNHHRNLLTKLPIGSGIVAGLSLLRHRSNFDFDMTTKCDSVTAFAQEWKGVLCTGTDSRYLPKKNVSSTASTNVESTPTTTKACNTSKEQRRSCCVDWCSATDTKMTRVPAFLKPIANTASKKQRQTHAQK